MDAKFTLVGSDDGAIYKIDTIEHEGVLWLVPEWVLVRDPEGQEPARAIRLTGLEFEEISHSEANYLVKHSIPKSVLFGPGLPEASSGFVVVVRQHDDRVSRPQ